MIANVLLYHERVEITSEKIFISVIVKNINKINSLLQILIIPHENVTSYTIILFIHKKISMTLDY